MLVTHDREKLINALVFFLGATKHAHTLKLFKLLNFSDFEHFRQTGRSIFNLEYRALPQGPVPVALLKEISKGGGADLKKAIALFEVKDEITDELLRRVLKAKIPFDPKFFSKRELKIMDRIAEFFRDFKAQDMSEFSHMKGLPWRTVYNDGKGRNNLIPLELALKSDPLVHDAATIAPEELEDRRELTRNIA
jgi:uncharacterized phage-associated protein